MSLEENNEQPQAKAKPPSDFNDLHVLAGLSEVRRQIKGAIESSDFAVDFPRTPLDSANHFSGQMVENGAENNEFNQNDSFSLDFSPTTLS